MKKDRNCGATPYPVYPGMNPNMGPMMNPNMGPMMNPNMGPMMNPNMGPMMNPNMGPMMNSNMGPGMNQGCNNPLARIEEQIMDLNKRVTKLESICANMNKPQYTTNNLNDNNYHMM